MAEIHCPFSTPDFINAASSSLDDWRIPAIEKFPTEPLQLVLATAPILVQRSANRFFSIG
jgi:hypothetical protein